MVKFLSGRSALMRYGGALVIMSIATPLRLWLDEALAGGGFMIYFVAVILASWFGGKGPSLLTLVSSIVLSIVIFPAPETPPAPAGTLFTLSVFFFTGLLTAMLGESLRAAQRRAEAADRRKDEFLAIVAHEMRNPLAPISMGLELLRQPGVDANSVTDTYEVMQRQLQHLARLVDDLLDVSRIARGKIELRAQLVELRNVVASALDSVQPLVDVKQQELTVSLPEEPIKLFVDPVRLAQVVGNLLTNAVRYTPAHGRIRLSGERLGGMAVIRVRDTGIGMSSDIIPQVFDLFVQAETNSTHGGLGIGLTLVKSLVEMSGGAVEAHSAGLGKGSEFIVRLPLAVPNQLTAATHEPAVTVRLRPAQAPCRRR